MSTGGASILRLALAAMPLLASLSACGCDGGTTAPASGAEMFRLQGCVTCHGDAGQGTALAPRITGAKVSWTRETMIEYLADPQAYAQKDARIAAQAGRYSLPMSRYGMLTPEERGKLADFVLALP